MYSDAKSDSGVFDVQEEPSSPPKTTQGKSPNAPEISTTQRDTSTPTESQIKIIEVEVVSVNPMCVL